MSGASPGSPALLGDALATFGRLSISIGALGAVTAGVLWGADRALMRAHLTGTGATVPMIVLWALVVFAETAAATSIALRHVRGEQPSTGAAFASAGVRLWAVTGASIFTAAAFTAGLAALVVPGLAALAALALALPAAVDERGGPWRAISRSVQLTRGHRLRVLVVVGGLILVTVGTIVATVTAVLRIEVAVGEQAVIVTALFASHTIAMLPAVGVAVVYEALRRIQEAPRGAELERVFE